MAPKQNETAISDGNLRIVEALESVTLTLKPGQVACIFDLRPNGNPGLYQNVDESTHEVTSTIVSTSKGARVLEGIAGGDLRLNLTAFRKTVKGAKGKGVSKRTFATMTPDNVPDHLRAKS